MGTAHEEPGRQGEHQTEKGKEREREGEGEGEGEHEHECERGAVGGGKGCQADGKLVASGDAAAAGFDYEQFLRRMKHPSCKSLVTMAKQFISNFRERAAAPACPSTSHLVHMYRNFLDIVMDAVRENPVWRLIGDARPEEYGSAREGIEYLLTNQLHSVAFSPSEDRERDAQLARKYALFAAWVQPSHLDISARMILDGDTLGAAMREFRRVAEYLTPRDKLICLLNGCRIVQNMVEMCEASPSADDTMPVLIYTVLKAQVGQLHSNLQYISRYRDPKHLASDSAYHFTTLLAVCTFIERMDRESLVIGDEEYTARMEVAIMELNGKTLATDEHAESAGWLAAGGEGEGEGQEEEEEEERRGHATLRAPPTTTAAAPPLPLPTESRFKDDAARVFVQVREKIKLGASKSMDYLGRLMEEAEAAVRAAVNSGSSSPPSDAGAATDRIAKGEQEEEEFELQLAMALSLSEQEYNALAGIEKGRAGGGGSDAGTTGELVDVQHTDGKSSSAAPS